MKLNIQMKNVDCTRVIKFVDNISTKNVFSFMGKLYVSHMVMNESM